MKQWAKEKECIHKRSCPRENRDKKGEERISRKRAGREEKSPVGRAVCCEALCAREQVSQDSGGSQRGCSAPSSLSIRSAKAEKGVCVCVCIVGGGRGGEG